MKKNKKGSEITTVHVRVQKSDEEKMKDRMKFYGINTKSAYMNFLFIKDVREGEDK